MTSIDVQYTYKRRRAYFMAAHVDSKCHQCRTVVEEGEEAVFVPNGEPRDRFFHAKCVATKLRKRKKYGGGPTCLTSS